MPFEVPDQERLLLAFLFDARAYGAEETAARETILAAAAPFRRRDGSYRFENAFRYVLSSPSRNPVSSTDLRSLRTQAQPPPAPSLSFSPATIGRASARPRDRG